MTDDAFSTNRRLRALVDTSELTLKEILDRMNRGQVRPLSLRTLKTYLASEDAKTRSHCPPSVLERAIKVCHASK